MRVEYFLGRMPPGDILPSIYGFKEGVNCVLFPDWPDLHRIQLSI